MHPVDPQVGDIANPIADRGADGLPENEVADVVGGTKPHAMKLHDAGIAGRKIAAAATAGAHHEVYPVVRGVFGQQRGLDITAVAFSRAGVSHCKAELTQALADRLESLIVPYFDPDACVLARIAAEAYRAVAVVRAKCDLAVMLRNPLQAENVRHEPRTGVEFADRKPDIADGRNQRRRLAVDHFVCALVD